MIWLTSDWHLGLKQIEWQSRPFNSIEEMHATFIYNHNQLVSTNDTVIVIGDVCDRGQEECLPIVDCFHGHKLLIRGNHDRGITDEKFLKYFDRVWADGSGRDIDLGARGNRIPCFLTHYPTQSRPDRFNLVGHIHDRWRVQRNMLNVGVDVNHFRPIPETAIPEIFKSINDRYDEDVWVANHPANTAHEYRGLSGRYFVGKNEK